MFAIIARAASVSADEAPALYAGFPGWGESPRIIEYSWTQLPFELVNPTDRERTLNFAVRPQQAEGMVFSKTLRIGPRSAYNDVMPMTGSHTRVYEGILTDEAGSMLLRQEIRSEFENPFQKRVLFFVNNNFDIEGVSELRRRGDLMDNVALTRSSAENTPQSWTGYGGASIICMIDPDYHTMSELQFRAVSDFVESGGTLLFVSPEGALAASHTPLADLLPVRPLRIRRIERFPDLERWARMSAAPEEGAETAGDLVWPRGAAFLESSPLDDTVVPLRRDDFPVFAWRRHGLGAVGVAAFSPFTDPIRESDVAIAVWDHLLTRHQAHPLTSRVLYSEPLNAATERLIGFQAPPADTVKLILSGYFLAIVFVFAIGTLVRRQVGAWIVNVAISVVVTAFIFSAAYRQIEDQPRKSITTIDLRCEGNAGAAGEKVVNLFSKVDARPSIRASDTDVFFRAPPPAPSPVPTSPGPQMLMQINRDAGISEIPRLAVHALRRTSFAAAYAGAPPSEPVASAVIQLSAERPALSEYLRPADIPAAAQAYLAFAGGFLRLRLDDGVYRIDYGGRGALELDPVTARFEDFLRGGLLPSPSVVFLYRQPQASPQFAVEPDDYQELQHVLHVRPAVMRTAAGIVRLVSEQIDIRPFSRNARALYWGNQWQESFLHGVEAQYEFSAHLPAVVHDMKLTQVTVDLDILNPAGNLATDVRLVAANAFLDPTGERTSAMLMRPTRATGNAFTFSNIDQRRFIDPRTGRILLRFTVRSTRPDPGASQLQAERWRVRRFRVMATGDVPEASHPKRY